LVRSTFDMFCSGSWDSSNGTLTSGSGTLTFDATTGTPTLKAQTASNALGNIIVNNAGVTSFILQNTIGCGSFDLQAGKFDPDVNAIAPAGNITIASGATLENTGTWLPLGTYNIINTNISNRFGGIVLGASSSGTMTGVVYTKSIASASGTTFDKATFDLFVSGSLSYTNVTLTAGTGKTVFDGTSGSFNLTAAGQNLGDLELNNAGATIVLQDTLLCGKFDAVAGTFTDNGKTLVADDDITIANVANMINSTGFWSITAVAANLSNPNSTNRLSSFFPGGTSVVTLIGDVYVGDFIAASASTINQDSFTLFCSGDFLPSVATWNGDTGKVVFDGTTGTPTISVNANVTFNDVEVDNSGTTSLIVSAGDLDVDGNFLVTDGVFDLNGKTLDLEGNYTVVAGTVVSGAAIYNVAGSWNTASGTFSGDTSSINFDGSSGVITFTTGGNTFNNITMNNAGVTSFTLVDALQIDGTMTLESGSKISLGANTMTVSGSAWTNNGGTLNGDTGKVVYDTATSIAITGDTTFNDWECITGSKVFTFADGSTQTITGVFRCKGTGVGSEIGFQSQTLGVQFKIDNQGDAEDVDFVLVRDCNNIAGAGKLITATNTTDLGNVDFWDISSPPLSFTPGTTKFGERNPVLFPAESASFRPVTIVHDCTGISIDEILWSPSAGRRVVLNRILVTASAGDVLELKGGVSGIIRVGNIIPGKPLLIKGDAFWVGDPNEQVLLSCTGTGTIRAVLTGHEF